MKTFLFAVLIIVLGAALGAGAAVLRVRMTPWNPQHDVSVENASVKASLDEPAPKVAVDAEEFDFGTVDSEQSGGEHSFTFTNLGKTPLLLAGGGTSCRCTMSKLGKGKILPGDSAKVTITWKPIDTPGPYRQTAKIMTNDPTRPQVELSIFGRVVTRMRFLPPELVFTRLSAGETSTGRARLYCYLEKTPKITGHTWSDTATASFFNVDLKPLSAEEIKEEPAAQSGMEVIVTVKPGLPQGPIRQKLALQTDTSASPSLLIEGAIGSEITVVGPGWNSDTNILSLGEISRQKGIKWRLLLLVRGPMRKKVEFQPGDVTPETLKVSIGERTEINNGAVVQIPLLIEIPSGSPPANHLGSEQGRLGEIILETSHPDVPKLRIFVRFAVEG